MPLTFEADKRTRAAKMKANATRSGDISKSAEPLLRLFMWLGVEEMATRRMINVEAFYDEICFVELDDKRIESDRVQDSHEEQEF